MKAEETQARSDYEGPIKAHSEELLPILLAVLGLHYDIIRVTRLETQFKPYNDLRADIVFELLLKSGKIIVVHIELQSTNALNMPLRMAKYYVAIWEHTNEAPLQIVLYTGQEKLSMESAHSAYKTTFAYEIVELSKVNGETLFAIETPLAQILAVFADTPDKIAAVRRVITFLRNLRDERKMVQYIRDLLNLSKSVKTIDMEKAIFEIIKETEPAESRFFDLLFESEIGKRRVEKAITEALAEGKAEGKAEGIEISKRQTARQYYQKGVPQEIIAEVCGVTLDELKTWLAQP